MVQEAISASMRPRPEGRGEPANWKIKPTSLQRSNAATARRPWRTEHLIGGCQRPAKGLQCEPRPEGRGERNGLGDSAPRIASMRPRPEGRGEHTEHRWKPHSRFNAATARRPWRTACRAGRRHSGGLQCGHGPKAVENGQRLALTREIPMASMRPRPEGRGQRSPSAARLGRPHASMRPRPEGRGEPRDAKQSVKTRIHSFDAATARRPWRTPKNRRGVPRGRHSMRPQPEGRGEPIPTSFRRRTQEVASMRPRPEGRGERRASGLADSASSRRLMRPQPEGRGELGKRSSGGCLPSLQCGHGPKAVESPVRYGGERQKRAEASMRPRPEGRGELIFTRSCRRLCASMRPRPEGRGEHVGWAASALGTASMRPRPEGRGERTWLRRRQSTRSSSFNAATTRRPWRNSRGVPSMRSTQLQCGHDPKAVEN